MASVDILSWTDKAWSDYLYWQKNDRGMLKRINILIRGIQRSPFEGLGKPEALRFDFSGCWSGRINDEHRLVYTIEKQAVIILACRYHYSNS